MSISYVKRRFKLLQEINVYKLLETAFQVITRSSKFANNQNTSTLVFPHFLRFFVFIKFGSVCRRTFFFSFLFLSTRTFMIYKYRHIDLSYILFRLLKFEEILGFSQSFWCSMGPYEETLRLRLVTRTKIRIGWHLYHLVFGFYLKYVKSYINGI